VAAARPAGGRPCRPVSLLASCHPSFLHARAPQLFLGDTNRTVSETPMNQASSRSHCVFTVSVEARRAAAAAAAAPPADGDGGAGGDAAGEANEEEGGGGGGEARGGGAYAGALVRRSKLHLVDLAGSERVGKTGSEGAVQREARCGPGCGLCGACPAPCAVVHAPRAHTNTQAHKHNTRTKTNTQATRAPVTPNLHTRRVPPAPLTPTLRPLPAPNPPAHPPPTTRHPPHPL
jgi:hypothetical protein